MRKRLWLVMVAAAVAAAFGVAEATPASLGTAHTSTLNTTIATKKAPKKRKAAKKPHKRKAAKKPHKRKSAKKK